jgi:hypothetical protein
VAGLGAAHKLALDTRLGAIGQSATRTSRCHVRLELDRLFHGIFTIDRVGDNTKTAVPLQGGWQTGPGHLGLGVGYYNLIPRRHTSRELTGPY